MRTLLISALYALCFISALQIILAQHEARKLFVEIQSLEKTRNTLNEEWGRLQLEQSAWATDDRIESEAKTNLAMKVPQENNIRLLAR